jgi:HSP20 family molecular chaperone IbpA
MTQSSAKRQVKCASWWSGSINALPLPQWQTWLLAHCQSGTLEGASGTPVITQVSTDFLLASSSPPRHSVCFFGLAVRRQAWRQNTGNLGFAVRPTVHHPFAVARELERRSAVFPILRNSTLVPTVDTPVNRLSTLFDRVFNDDLFTPAPPQGMVQRLSLWQDEHNIYAEVDLPGMTDQDIDVSVHGADLIVRGERQYKQQGRRVRHAELRPV